MNKFYQKIKERIKENYFIYIILINARANVFYFLNKVFGYFYTKRKFYKKMGYPLNLKNPQSFHEKLVWKKIHDRNPLLSVTADKYQVRSYIKEVLGEEQAKEILVPLLYVTDKPQIIPFKRLSLPCILKPNHASGRNIIIENGNYIQKELVNTCKKWLQIPYGLDKLEWAYQSIRRKIVIQKLLKDENGKLPEIEYKFYIFHGKCEIIRVDSDLNCDLHHLRRVFFKADWKLLDVTSNNRKRGPYINSPGNLSKMIKIAEKLSRPFDFVRVDLYNINGKIYFGELTHYPASGMDKFVPQSFDFRLGKYWKIEKGYWKKNNELD